ncbi:MAG: cytochrome c maturation protein CcmE [Caldilinea sp.]|uniref:cytochrome c maturation protein CcmE n=1 Tax=Caldilinea sp. TaxID=2293560 RepID=UPI002C745407|nr:cytochrome c maturation protein CcmE [Caldilinea sp.]
MTQEVHPISIPSNLGEHTRTGFNTKYLAGGLLLILFVGFLVFQVYEATTTTGAYYLTVSELNARTPQIYGERVRVNGNVVIGSEDWNAREVTLRFAIVDESQQTLPIVFYGPRPDNFQRAASAIVEGELLPDGTFQAETLLLKCPSRYEEDPEEVYVESIR